VETLSPTNASSALSTTFPPAILVDNRLPETCVYTGLLGQARGIRRQVIEP